MFVFWSYRKNFAATKNEFEPAMVNEPSVFQPLRFYCMLLLLTRRVTLDRLYEYPYVLVEKNGITNLWLKKKYFISLGKNFSRFLFEIFFLFSPENRI